MPATLPSAGVKKRNDESPQGKEDPNPGAGDTGWGATGRNRWPERPKTGAQDVVMAHEDQQTARSPTGGGGGGGGRRCPSNVGGSSSSPASHSVIRVRYSVRSLIRSSSTACPVTRAWTCSLRLSTRSSGDGPPLIRLSGRPRNTGGHPSLQSYICWMTRSIWSMMTLRSLR